MNCASDGILRAHIDNELGPQESEAIERHLQICQSCRERSTAIASQAQHVQQQLSPVAENFEESTIDPMVAYARYHELYSGEPRGRSLWFRQLFMHRRRPLWGALAACFALVLLLSFAPNRSWAQKFLAMFRVQKVAVVPVDLSILTGENGRAKLLTQLISDNVVVTMKPGAPTPVSSAEAAGEMAGFKVRTLDALGPATRAFVREEGAFHVTVDRDRIQAVLDQAGRSDIQIPVSVDGSTIAVHLPRVVRMTYGACPSNHDAGAAGENCIDFEQVRSPIVSVPPSMNIAPLAEAGLQLAGMSAAEAHAFCETVDWSSTLVIPIPLSGSSYQTIPVDGVHGTLIQVAPQGNFIGTYELIWVKNGIVYSLHGKGSANRALSAASSLN